MPSGINLTCEDNLCLVIGEFFELSGEMHRINHLCTC